MTTLVRPSDVVWHHATVTRKRREALNGHRAALLWFTGFSGAGKSTLAHSVEEQLHQRGCRTIVLDGDNVRHGLCADLGFSQRDRTENVRRIGEVAKLFVEAGTIVLAAFISPSREDRRRVRALLGQDFVEIYCDCSLSTCERRDVKGMYERARRGEIPGFTGISAPYDIPEAPELVVDTESNDLDGCVRQVAAYLVERGIVGTSA